MTDPQREFPILHGPGPRTVRGIPASVPWDLVAAHEAQALRNHGGQTLRRLAERGGLGPWELLAVLLDCAYSNIATLSAESVELRLNMLLRGWSEGDREGLERGVRAALAICKRHADTHAATAGEATLGDKPALAADARRDLKAVLAVRVDLRALIEPEAVPRG